MKTTDKIVIKKSDLCGCRRTFFFLFSHSLGWHLQFALHSVCV